MENLEGTVILRKFKRTLCFQSNSPSEFMSILSLLLVSKKSTFWSILPWEKLICICSLFFYKFLWVAFVIFGWPGKNHSCSVAKIPTVNLGWKGCSKGSTNEKPFQRKQGACWGKITPISWGCQHNAGPHSCFFWEEQCQAQPDHSATWHKTLCGLKTLAKAPPCCLRKLTMDLIQTKNEAEAQVFFLHFLLCY